MWGGIYVILPVSTVIGGALGYVFAFIIEIIVT